MAMKGGHTGIRSRSDGLRLVIQASTTAAAV